jgi:hypothetical protein
MDFVGLGDRWEGKHLPSLALEHVTDKIILVQVEIIFRVAETGATRDAVSHAPESDDE